MFSTTSETNNHFVNICPDNIPLANNPFPQLNSFAGNSQNIAEIATKPVNLTNKLDHAWTLVNSQINEFFGLFDWEVKTKLALTGDWSEAEAKDFFNHISPSQISVKILPANNMPGIAGGYDAITGKIYLSEDLLKYSDPAKIAEVLIEEIGHKADDILNPGQDSPGDEGEILAKLISNQGSIPADWQVLKQENDHKFIQVGDAWIGVEASESVQQEWLQQFGSEFYDNSSGITIDTQGNIYLTGSTFGNLGGVNVGSSDAWVAKYNAQGQQQWLQQFGSEFYDNSNGITIDTQGNIYLTGTTDGDLGGVNVGNTDTWIAKYNAQGQQQWLQQFGSSSSDQSSSITIDTQGNIYLTGFTDGDLGGVNVGNTDTWIAKYNAQGQQQWLQQFGSEFYDISNSITIDTQGNIYLTGSTFGNLGGVNVGNTDTWIAKYNAQGQQQWLQQFGSSSSDQSSSITIDTQGNIYLTGTTDGDLGGINVGSIDTWIAKYNAQGQQQWLQQFGSASSDYSNSITIDTQGNIYLTGTTDGDLGGVNVGNTDTWIAKYNAQGQQQWLQQFGSASYDYSYGITVDTQGNIYLTGFTDGDLGYVNFGSANTWVAKYTQNISAAVIPNISIQDVSIREGNSGQKNADFKVTLDKASEKAVTVQYTTVNDTAKAGNDFVNKTGKITFKPGVKSQTISVPIIGDTVFEPNEKFSVKLSLASNGKITKAKGIGTIINDDVIIPNISIQDVSIIEGNSGQKNADFKVTLDKVSNQTVTVQYTTVDDTAQAGQDFVNKTGKITFKPGVKSQTISMPIIGDTVFEPNEKFTVKLSAASNGKITNANGIGTITNDDRKVMLLPNISIQDVRIREGNSGQKNADFKVTLDKASEKAVTVQYTTVNDTAKAGNDFVNKTGKITFKPGVKSQTISIPIIGDKIFEANERFSVKLNATSNGKITKANGIGTIITNDDVSISKEASSRLIFNDITWDRQADDSIKVNMKVFNRRIGEAFIQIYDAQKRLVNIQTIDGNELRAGLIDNTIYLFTKVPSSLFTYSLTDPRKFLDEQEFSDDKKNSIIIPSGGSLKITKSSNEAILYNTVMFGFNLALLGQGKKTDPSIIKSVETQVKEFVKEKAKEFNIRTLMSIFKSEPMLEATFSMDMVNLNKTGEILQQFFDFSISSESNKSKNPLITAFKEVSKGFGDELLENVIDKYLLPGLGKFVKVTRMTSDKINTLARVADIYYDGVRGEKATITLDADRL